MGAWGARVFDDDTALDFLEEQLIPRADPRVVMRKAFEAALAADYVEYDAGQAVLASAAVILSAKNGQPLDDDETEARVAWREGLAALDFAALAELGSKACLRVCGKSSELRELWEEDADLLSAWIGNVESLARGLKQNSSGQ
ncbi:DUF4259 domain-containing protein [Dyella kyungheensis]|jgi:hypothetical protein|uniref:DUF4259 domain-containing protein n=1 Tax=Dyella kyungheensis TaxID=1242174 RepID=A0ABS2JT28_9GAMM|nr:DUF4259 domain-containing protein [Dyella kyungheensis]MBM7122174.1 DUF4259 domain-containing protein [Dyella kyungheensis]